MWGIVLFFQFIHLVYHQFTTLFDLYPFNNIRSYSKKEQLLECGVNALFMGFPVVAMLLQNNILIWISAWCYLFTLVAEYFSWWRGYLFEATTKWQEAYEKKFKETIVILPAIKNNPIPNLEHTILHGLTFVSALLTFGYAYFKKPISAPAHAIIAGCFIVLIRLMIRWCKSFHDK